MINLNQRHVLTVIDLIKEEETRLRMTGIKRINPAGNINIDNWDKEETNNQDRNSLLFLEELRKMLEQELNKATFSFGLNERVQSIHE